MKLSKRKKHMKTKSKATSKATRRQHSSYTSTFSTSSPSSFYPIDISNQYSHELISSKDIGNNLYLKKLLVKRPSRDPEVNVTWDFNRLRQAILKYISPRLYGWYHENTSSCGNSTYAAIEAYNKIRITPNYLNANKTVSMTKDIVLHSKALGTTEFSVPCPFFTAPYGCASEYGGKSNEIDTLLGTIHAGGIYTIACLTEYNLEYLAAILKKNSREKPPFFMFQLYLTGDNDINISLIERAKACGVSVIMITMDTGSNNHGGIGLLENQADLTFSRNFCGNLYADPVFNIKCYEHTRCVGTKDRTILQVVADHTKLTVNKLLKSYDATKSFDFAKQIQGQGMGNLNVVTDPSSAEYTLSLYNAADICHSPKTLCKYVPSRAVTKGIPLIVKGCISVRNALEVQKANADGIYVSNHGGRFTYNSVAPLDILNDIRVAVKKVHPHFGVWFDGGIRNGQDIFTAYTQGAEFVGVGRPIIYACVLYGQPGVSSITKKMSFELEGQCKICGQNDLNHYDKLKQNVITDKERGI